jgi:hypothetical protein
MFVVASLSGILQIHGKIWPPIHSATLVQWPWFSGARLVDIQSLSVATRSRIKQDYYGVKPLTGHFMVLYMVLCTIEMRGPTHHPAPLSAMGSPLLVAQLGAQTPFVHYGLKKINWLGTGFSCMITYSTNRRRCSCSGDPASVEPVLSLKLSWKYNICFTTVFPMFLISECGTTFWD